MKKNGFVKILGLVLLSVMVVGTMLACTRLLTDSGTSETSESTSEVTSESTSEATSESTSEAVHKHSYSLIDSAIAYCGSDGYNLYKCSTCGMEYKEDVVYEGSIYHYGWDAGNGCEDCDFYMSLLSDDTEWKEVAYTEGEELQQGGYYRWYYEDASSDIRLKMANVESVGFDFSAVETSYGLWIELEENSYQTGYIIVYGNASMTAAVPDLSDNVYLDLQEAGARFSACQKDYKSAGYVDFYIGEDNTVTFESTDGEYSATATLTIDSVDGTLYKLQRNI